MANTWITAVRTMERIPRLAPPERRRASCSTFMLASPASPWPEEVRLSTVEMSPIADQANMTIPSGITSRLARQL
jgi:hypothetical protein